MATAINQGQKTKAEVEMGKFIQETLELSPEDAKKLSVRYKKGQFDYLLTYDMGCGNSSAALISLTGAFIPRMISWPVSDASNSDVTILGRDIRGKKYSGYYAVNLSGSIENFKCLPTSENLGRKFFLGIPTRFPEMPLREVWTNYFDITFSHCLNYANSHVARLGGKPVTWGNTLLLVAHPAGPAWCKELLNYREMIMKATGLPSEQVITFSEAKASMMYARQKKEYGQFILQDGVDSLVIDLGASTIDILHIDALGNPKKEFSITFAGRDVDEVIGYAVLNDLFPDFMVGQPRNKIPPASFFKNHELDMDRTRFKFLIRFAKEEACNHPGGKQIISMALDKEFTLDAKRILNLLQEEELCVTGVDMDFAKFMNKNAGSDSVTGTWNEILTNVVAYTAKDMEPNQPCQIVVSGGTANLVGVKDCVEHGAYNAGFANSKLVILNEPNDYDRAVPIGSGEYMLRVLNNLDTLEKFTQKLTAIINSWLKDCAVLCIAEPITEDAIIKVKNILATWVNAPEENTVWKLTAQIKNGISYGKKEIDNLVVKGLESYFDPDDRRPALKRLTEEINKACDDLLAKISPNNQAVGYLIEKLDFDIDTGSLEKAVKEALAGINWVSMLSLRSLIWGAIKNLFGGNNNSYTSLLGQKKKEEIYENFQKSPPKNAIRVDIKKSLDGTLRKQCDATDCFGIPGNVMERMKPLLGLAMFQQADLAEKEDTVVFTN